MDVVLIYNGLGNQMSQYAFYLQKKKINKNTYFIPFCHDHNGLELEDVFGLDLKLTFRQRLLYVLFRILLTQKFGIVNRIISRGLNFFDIRIQKENFDYNFKSDYMKPSKGITFYYGGWHTEKYFVEEAKQLILAFKFKGNLGEVNEKYAIDITNSNSVSIHVRRGDFMNSLNIGLFGGVATKAYFEEAIKFISKKISNPKFYVFSNDMDWVKMNLHITNVCYVTCNSGKDSWKDMSLMSLCKHNIIPNSTFSWWGAWLNNNSQKIVVCPSKFLNNDICSEIYPDSWIKLTDY